MGYKPGPQWLRWGDADEIEQTRIFPRSARDDVWVRRIARGGKVDNQTMSKCRVAIKMEWRQVIVRR
jgi:hypothetical protein